MSRKSITPKCVKSTTTPANGSEVGEECLVKRNFSLKIATHGVGFLEGAKNDEPSTSKPRHVIHVSDQCAPEVREQGKGRRR